MTAFEQGCKAFEELGSDAVNPFDFATESEYLPWLEFEKGWDVAMKCSSQLEKDNFVD